MTLHELKNELIGAGAEILELQPGSTVLLVINRRWVSGTAQKEIRDGFAAAGVKVVMALVADDPDQAIRALRIG